MSHQQVSLHNLRYHNVSRKSPQTRPKFAQGTPSSLDSAVGNEFSLSEFESHHDVSLPKNGFWGRLKSLMRFPPVFRFSRSESSQFFKMEQNGLGAAYLVGYSCFQQEDIAGDLDPDEVNLHVNLAHLVSTQSRYQNEILAKVV